MRAKLPSPPYVDLAKSDPVEAVEYVFLLLEMGAAGRELRDPSGAAAVRKTVDTVRRVMKLKKAPR
jgi:hypothetical protein